jgi:SAM-dependent methyltransferase
MEIANREQAEHWNSGDDAGHWVTKQARYDGMLAAFGEMVLTQAELAPGEAVLDIGCGCGATTLAAASAVASGAASGAASGVAPGRAVGADLSAPMLARAREDAAAAGLSNITFIEADAQIHPFDPASFDAVISRFGVMFFNDPVAAFGNLRAAARPGGRLSFVCWQPMMANEWLVVAGGALAEHVPFPEHGPPDAPGMFALADPDRVRRILSDSGWSAVGFEGMETQMPVGGTGTIDDAVDFLRTGSLGRTMLAGADDDTRARAEASVRAALAPFATDDGVYMGAAVWLVRATA